MGPDRSEPGCLIATANRLAGGFASWTSRAFCSAVRPPTIAVSSCFGYVPGGTYWLHGLIDGLPSPLPDLLRPLPADAALRGHAMVPATVATVESGHETAVELRARPVGYVRGTVRLSAGQKAADFNIRPMHDPRVTQPVLRYDPDSGEFLHGPLLPGNVNYSLERADEGFDGPGAEIQSVDVPGGDVAQLDFRPEPPPVAGAGPKAGRAVSAPARAQLDPGSVVMSVVLDDGRTPAYAARALAFVPWRDEAVNAGLQRRGRWAHLARAMAWLLVWNRAR